MSEPLSYIDNPLAMCYKAVKDFLFCEGHERFIKSLTAYDPEADAPFKTKAPDEHLAAWLSQTGLRVISYNSHSAQVEITYEVLFNSGDATWTTKLFNADWWFLCKSIEARTLNPMTVKLNGRNIVVSFDVTDGRSGVVPQQTAGKYNLTGWNSYWQVVLAVDIPLTSIKIMKEL